MPLLSALDDKLTYEALDLEGNLCNVRELGNAI